METSTTSLNEFDLTGKVIVENSMPIFTGNYSNVYQGTFEGKTVAVKVIKATGNPASMQRKILRERTICASLDHPNIHPFYGFANDQAFAPFGALISPWFSRGEASKFLEEHGARMSEIERIDLWGGVVDGVAYLHAHDPVIVHGDLKPGNILIDDYGQPRICDFGLSQLFLGEKDTGLTTTSEHTGTERYLAPELVMSESTVYPTTRSDIYALGCLGLEFIYLKRPYFNRKNNLRGHIIRDLRSGVPPAPDPEEPWSNLWLLIRSCWDKAEELRPSVITVVRLSAPFSKRQAANQQATIVETTGDRDWRMECSEKIEMRNLIREGRLQQSDYVDTAKAAENLAAAYSKHGRWNDAEKLQLEALETLTKVQGVEHLDTVAASGKLATTYFWQGRLSDAEKLQWNVLQNRTKVQGEVHPDTVDAAEKLGATYYRQGRFADAEKLQSWVLINRKKIQGAEHLDTLAAAGDLAATYYFQGRWNDAEQLELETLNNLTRIQGSEHPDTIASVENLGSIYCNQARYGEAEKLQLIVLENRARILGVEHPHTIRASENLAKTYFQQRRWNNVEKLQWDILQTRTKVDGTDHLDTIEAANKLAIVYENQERWKDAEKLLLWILENRARINGKKHRDTIDVAGRLAAVYRKRRRFYHALKLDIKYELKSV